MKVGALALPTHRRLSSILVVLWVACARGPGAAAAPPPAYTVLESGVAPLRAYVGDPIELRVRLRLTAAAAELRAPRKLPEAPWMDLRSVRVVALGAGEWDVRVQLVAFAAGEMRLPALDLTAVVLDGLRVQTTSILEEKKVDRLAAPREQLDLPGAAWRLSAIAGLAVGAPLAAVFLGLRAARLYRLARARRRRALPMVRLRRILKRLRARHERLGGRAFYIELTEALRAYLEGRHGLRATTATSSEVRLLLRGLPGADPQAVHGLAQLLERSDRVKFGGITADSREMLAAADCAEASARRLEEGPGGDA